MAGTSKVSLPPAIEIACGRLKCPTSADFRSALFLWYDSWYLLFCWKCLFGKSSIWFREFKASGVCANAAWLCNKTPKDYFCCPQGNSSLACHQRQLAIACISSYVATWQCVFSRQENSFVCPLQAGIWGWFGVPIRRFHSKNSLKANWGPEFFLHHFVSCCASCRWTHLELCQLGNARLVPHGANGSRVAWQVDGEKAHRWCKIEDDCKV